MSGVFGNPWLYDPSDDFFSTTIDNSLRFTASQTPYLTFGQTKTPTDIAKWTVNFWLKRTEPLDESDDYDTVWGVEGPGNTAFTFLNSNLYLFINYADTGGQARLITNRKFRDPSSWYNFHVSFDRANSTDAHKVRFYVNGVEETSFSTDERNLITTSSSTGWNVNGESAAINRRSGTQDSRYHNGYLAQFYNIDGQALDPTSFIEISDGVCKPKAYTGTFGNQGWFLEFKQSGVGTGASNTVGADTSGNDNHWSSFNVESHDRMLDSPTSNFSTLQPLFNSVSQAVLSEGNLKAATAGFTSSAFGYGATSTFAIPKDKKIYIEVECTDAAGDLWFAGFATQTSIETGVAGNTGSDGSINCYNRSVKVNGTEIDYQSSAGLGGLGVAKLAAGDVLGCMIDGATGKVWFSRNGAYFKSPSSDNSGTTGDPDGGNHEIGTLTGGTTDDVFFVLGGNATPNDIFVNFGQDSINVASANTDANGLGTFEYAPPTDYVCLASSSLSDATIGPRGNSLPSENFDVVLFSGTGADQTVSGFNFQPDFVWNKTRNQTRHHTINDSVRGGAHLKPSNDDGQGQSTISAYNSDGYDWTYNSTNVWYDSSATVVSWSWKAGGATPTKTYKVRVDSDGGQNKYRFRNSADDATFATYAPTVELQEGGTYVFDWSHSTAQGHPIRFSTTSDGTHGGGTEYTTGVVKDDSAYTTTITVAASAPTLYYYCQIHSGMGGQVNTNSTFGSSDFDGSIQSVVSANPDAGFSITTYTGDNSSSASTVGHGLGVAPSAVFLKRTDTGSSDWIIGHQSLATNAFANSKFLKFNSTNGTFTNSLVWGSEPTSTVIQVTSGSGATNLNASGGTYVMYLFKEIESYSKIGSFSGNSSSDGTYVFCGFRPKWVLIKSISDGTSWCIYDSERLGYNVDNNLMRIAAATEQTDDDVDFLSNGFKLRRNSANFNQGTLVFIAFADQNFKFSNSR